jgi:serine/threonine-protein kinase
MDLEWLGPYQIVGKLGRGGMGTVYEGVHRETGEPAALKLLSPALAQEEGFRIRFAAEIETLRKLNHPNIVRLFGFGEQDEQLYYAMELVDGNSLEEELRRGRRFDWREVTQIGIEICRALRHAHDRGIIHRDIKPGNLLMVADGRVKLSDFGIARLFGNTGLTSPGNVLGTAEYMAPEQAEGGPIDGRADLYSLGTLMYALLARRPVFRGKSLPEMLHMQRFDQPEPLRKHVPDAPEELERILAQLLEKDPNRRVPNANLLGRRLETMLQALPATSETAAAAPDWLMRDESFVADEVRRESLPRGGLTEPEPDHPDGNLPITQALPPAVARATQSSAEATPPEPKPAGAVSPPPTRGHFVLVAEEELDRAATDEPRPTLFSWRTSWQTWVLAAALLSVGLTIRWFLQPPSADALYNRIDARASDSSPDALAEAEGDIHEFLSRYPSDSRAGQLRGYEKDIDLYRLEHRFNQGVNKLAGREGLRPIEQAYLEALNYLLLDTARGMAKLQALVDLYKDSDDVAGPAAQCLTLAQRRLAKLQAEMEKHAAQQLKLLRERLTAADALRPRDPEGARAMYRAMVELYGDKPWATDAIRRAREALTEKPSRKP